MTETESLHVRLSASDREALRIEAAAQQTTIADIARLAIREHLARSTAARAVPVLDAALGKHIDRLAALIAKTFVAADMANWQAQALCKALLRDIQPERILVEARQRALIDLRGAGTDIGESRGLYAPRA